jgi:flagellar assembly protein FliH
MSSTFRVLRADEHAAVRPVWWRENTPPPAPPALVPQSKGFTDEDRSALEKTAYQRGFSEGKSVGREQAVTELQPLTERITRSLAELSSARTRLRKEAEKDLLKLAIAIARRVLHRELTLDPESIEGVIKVALDKLQSRELSRVRVHPDQLAAVKSALERHGNAARVEMIGDSSLQNGDVLFETVHGTLDASIESQLREIERGFADRIQR